MKRLSASLLTLALILGGTGQAKADLGLVFSGTAYQSTGTDSGGNTNVFNAAANPTVAAPPTGTTAHASFTSAPSGGLSLNYNSPPSAYTTGAFLNNPTFTGAVNGFSAGATANNNYVLLTSTLSTTAGTTYTFNISHDDGVQLTLNGSPVITDNTANQPGINTYSFTAGSNGSVAVAVAYGEHSGAPAVLQLSVTATTATPEPATLTMAGCGLVAFGGYKLRRKRVVA